MEFRLLGPLDVVDGGRSLPLGGPKQRSVLAVLLLDAGRVVPAEQLIDELWGETPPATVAKIVQVYVSRLRKQIGGERLLTRPPGYVADVADQLDLVRFERLLARARAADPERTARLLREALAMWRGPPLADLAYEPFAQVRIARLRELRLEALEERIEADLCTGRNTELVRELELLVAEHPLRERLRGQLMLALYRSGRQAEALESYLTAREALISELGIEPGRRLRELHQAILEQADGLEAQPRPATPIALSHRALPVPPNRTIGREHDIKAVGERLQAGSVRLLTLTGPGGVGKTRLALEAARAVEANFADGAHFVSLAALHRAADVPAAIVKALAIMVLPDESADQAAERFLAAKHLLLVTDNFEQLLAAAPFISRLLEACPSLTVLATSREPLALQAEQRYLVSPLALPAPGTPSGARALADADAVALFCERARAHDADLDLGDANADAAAEICRRVDGLPLAIELAAARCGLLSPAEIADRLDATLAAPGVGARDAPARQQTLRATIDWSHELLTDAERQCFARFSVFAGGATVDAAETVTSSGLDTLDGLVTKSLLARRQNALRATRLDMLETIRAYARERFASAADVDAVREDHCRYYLALAQRHGTDRALRGGSAGEHLARLDAEVDNLNAALGWAVAQPNVEQAVAMTAALGSYWLVRGRYADAVDWIEQVLDLPGADAYPALYVRVLCTKDRCLWPLGRGAEQAVVGTAAESIARRLGDPVTLSQALQSRAHHEIGAERLEAADALADEALRWARAAGDDWEIAEASRAKAIAASSIADLRERVDRAALLLNDVGNVYEHAGLLADAAYAALCLGSGRDATDFAARASPIARTLDSPFVLMVNSGNLGLAALLTGETDTALHAFREELTLCRDMVVRPQAYEGLRGMAAIAVVDRADQRAATLVGAADAHRYDNTEDPVVTRLEAAFFEPARTRCGTDAWTSAARAGSALSFEDAVAYALEEASV
jgi:predicted ATPase/DNA-binding SARP family transcriptional activator